MELTQEDGDQVEALLCAVRDVLGEGLVGAYMHGSAVLDGFRPRSDIDVLVVSAHRTSRAQKQHLVDRLLAISSSPEAGLPRPLELTIVVQSEIRPWHYPPAFDFQYGEWWRDEFERGDIEPWPSRTNPDVASLVAMVLLGDWALYGPPPAQVFDPVPEADYLDAAVSGIQPLLGDLDSDTRNVVLTLARIWNAVSTRSVPSKDGAAAWAIARLPAAHRPVLARARAIYRGEEEERWDDLREQVRPYADHVVAEIGRTARP